LRQQQHFRGIWNLMNKAGASANLATRLSNLRYDQRGAVSVIGVFTLVSVIGIAAFSIELGQGYQAKISYQGAADAAALAAANAYTSSPNDAALTAAAQDIARANDVLVGNVTITHLTNFSNTVTDAVQVTIRTTVPLYFARIFSSASSYDVSTSAIASLNIVSAVPCILALSPSNGITLTGGTRIDAPNCSIVSNSSISVNGGSVISAKATRSTGSTSAAGGSTIAASTTVTYGTSASTEAGSVIKGTQVKKSSSTADPLANSTALNSAFSQLGKYTSPTVPAVPQGSDMSLGYYPTTMTFQGRNGTLTDGTWTFPAGTYNIQNLNTASLKLRILGPSTVTVSRGWNSRDQCSDQFERGHRNDDRRRTTLLWPDLGGWRLNRDDRHGRHGRQRRHFGRWRWK
jgi:Flp pilus assembly protein TadG